jgi:hypothetical protein
MRRHRYDRLFARLDEAQESGEPPASAFVREPLRPRPPFLSGGVALDLPDE